MSSFQSIFQSLLIPALSAYVLIIHVYIVLTSENGREKAMNITTRGSRIRE